MARKNPFASLEDKPADAAPAKPVEYAMRGASRSILSSIDDMSDKARMLVAGETVVELDPGIVDASFVQDRLAIDDAEFNELLEAIKERGQDSPILVRPHPSKTGRYMVVFGHRRLRAATLLGRKIRAVVKEMGDRDHVVAQGQENSARANLSFIERATFAASLSRLNYDPDSATVLAALSIDRATLSKMLSVTGMPADILSAIGPAKGVGRDRWYELKTLLENPANHDVARQATGQADYASLPSDDRFLKVVTALKAAKVTNRSRSEGRSQNWAPEDGALSGVITTDGKRFTLALKARGKDAQAFGEFLSEQLDQLYESFRQASKH